MSKLKQNTLIKDAHWLNICASPPFLLAPFVSFGCFYCLLIAQNFLILIAQCSPSIFYLFLPFKQTNKRTKEKTPSNWDIRKTKTARCYKVHFFRYCQALSLSLAVESVAMCCHKNRNEQKLWDIFFSISERIDI